MEEFWHYLYWGSAAAIAAYLLVLQQQFEVLLSVLLLPAFMVPEVPAIRV